MVDFLTLTANSNVSRLDIFDFSDFFDFQADVPPEINDLRNPGFGLWFALSSSKGKRTASRAWAHWKGEASCWVNFETRLANEALLPLLMPLRTRNSWPPPRMEMNWVLKVSPSVTNEALMSLRRRRALHEVPADDSSGDNGITPGLDLADASPDPEATYLQKEEARIVSAAIRHLRPGMRRAVELRELGDLSTQETARRMGLSVAAIKGRVFHARKELGKALRYHAFSLEGRS